MAIWVLLFKPPPLLKTFFVPYFVAEVPMATARNGDIEMFYLDEGAGEPVLLIHGHTLDHRIWDDVTPVLVEHGLRVIRPDLRGHGRSTMPSKGYHLSHHAGDMLAVLDAAGVERATVVGFSVGGGIAMELAVTHPERVEALALVAPVMPDRPFEAAFLDNLKAVAKVARTEGIRAAMAGPWASSPLFRVSLAKPGIREKIEPILLDFPGAEYLATERDRVERDWTIPERLQDVQAPTVVLVGGEEMAGFKGYAAEAGERIPGAAWHEVPGCGHLLPVEAPGDVVSAVLEVTPEAAG